jgi:hypothetical protein
VNRDQLPGNWVVLLKRPTIFRVITVALVRCLYLARDVIEDIAVVGLPHDGTRASRHRVCRQIGRGKTQGSFPRLPVGLGSGYWCGQVRDLHATGGRRNSLAM